MYLAANTDVIPSNLGAGSRNRSRDEEESNTRGEGWPMFLFASHLPSHWQPGSGAGRGQQPAAFWPTQHLFSHSLHGTLRGFERDRMGPLGQCFSLSSLEQSGTHGESARKNQVLSLIVHLVGGKAVGRCVVSAPSAMIYYYECPEGRWKPQCRRTWGSQKHACTLIRVGTNH